MQKTAPVILLSVFLTCFISICYCTGWRFCNRKDQNNYIVRKLDLSNLPTQFKPNSLVRVSITGLNTTTITKGDARRFPFAVVKLGFNKKYIVNRKVKICSRVRCPIKKGMVSYLIRTRIHSLAPSGNYQLHIKLVNSNNKILTCIIGNVHVDPPQIINTSKKNSSVSLK